MKHDVHIMLVKKIFVTSAFLLFCGYKCCVHGQEETEKPFVRGTCGGNNGEELGGAFASPGYPDVPYPANQSCTYEIKVPKGYIVVYKSRFFDLERKRDGYCLDFVEVTDLLGLVSNRFCGSENIYETASTSETLNFTFVSDGSQSGDGFAISWFALDISNTPQTFNCSFDGPIPLCGGWSQSDQDQFDWSFGRGSTPSTKTGPSFDHSTKSDIGKYAYIEASGIGKNYTALLVSPEINLNEYDEYCLQLWYHNNGTGKLNIVLIFGEENGELYTVSESNEGNEWRIYKQTIESATKPIRVGILAIRGETYRSDVAVDDINLMPGPCNVIATEPPDIDEITPGALEAETTAAGYTCTEDDFICDGATVCIPQDYRCNGQQDCFDGTDELNCKAIIMTTPVPAMASTMTTTIAATDTTALICPTNLVFVECGKACTHTCADGEDGPTCNSDCKAGCSCPTHLPVLHDGMCIKYESCPALSRPLEKVSHLRAANITRRTAEIIFNITPTTSSYRIDLFESRSNTLIHSKIINATYVSDDNAMYQYVLSDLASGLDYTVQVYSLRNSEEVSSSPLKFTTLIFCDETITDEVSGVIRSPSILLSNTSGPVNCTYLIISSPGSHIEFEGNFEFFGAPETQTCQDYLDVYRSGYVNDVRNQYCSSGNIERDSSFGDRLRIHFLSHESSRFFISWNAVDASKLPVDYNCSFHEVIQLCPGWNQPSLDDEDWMFYRRSLQADVGILLETKGYALMKSNFPQSDKKALLMSPMFETDTNYCLGLRYYIFGDALLTVLKVFDDDRVVLRELMYVDNLIDTWMTSYLTINDDGLNKPFKIGFEGKQGSTLQSWVAIEEIVFLPENYCFSDFTTSDPFEDVAVMTTIAAPISCPGFLCSDGQCLDLIFVCDGYPDCANDEESCVSQNPFPIGTTTDPVEVSTSSITPQVTTGHPTTTTISSQNLTNCQKSYAEVEEMHANNPEIQDGPIYPSCLPDGSFAPRQCNMFVVVCWCVNTTNGDLIIGTTTLPGKGLELNCDNISLFPTCGGNFTDGFGVIESPNYPSPYTTLWPCIYNIVRVDKKQYVEITITDMQLAPQSINGQCLADRVVFANEHGFSYSLCGQTFPTTPLLFGFDVSIQLVPVNQIGLYKGFSLGYSLKRCEISNQEFSHEALACDRTCDNLNPVCTRNLVERCICPEEYPILFNERCIEENQCPELTTVMESTTAQPSTVNNIRTAPTTGYHSKTMMPHFENSYGSKLPEAVVSTASTLLPTLSSAILTSSQAATSDSSHLELPEVTVLDIDTETICVKIKHTTRADSYLVTADLIEVSSEVGISDTFQDVVPTTPYTYACFFDLVPSGMYSTSVQAKIGKEFIKTAKVNMNFTKPGVVSTPMPPVYEQTESIKQWKDSYNQWRNQTLNQWYPTFSTYVKAVSSQLKVEPDPSKCLIPVRPSCGVKPKTFVDFNGCLFFICESPSKQGIITQKDVLAWQKEYAIFNNYLMPLWRKLLNAYSQTVQQELP
ncbi:uncharacterized protein LOC143446068 isoform X2 [Clavelina lepadiformis]|uniref:uncharacterized protein LOC143446068 isoform X2 n=1 Tax=Clavelina lepadiformis TaxID=159417 RepID=UPI004041B6DD